MEDASEKLKLSHVGLTQDEVAIMSVRGGRPSCPVPGSGIYPYEGIETEVS